MNISSICHFWVFCFSLRCTDQTSGLLMFIINSDYYYYYAYELAGKFQIHGYISPCRHCYLLLFCFERFPIFVLKTDEEHSPFNSMFNSIRSYELYFLQLLTTPCQNPSHAPLLSNATANSFPATWFQSPLPHQNTRAISIIHILSGYLQL